MKSPADSASDIALTSVPGYGPEPQLDVVFVHGLGDRDVTAWQRSGAPGAFFWPGRLAATFPESHVRLLRYGAAKFWFTKTAMPLTERAKMTLDYMVNRGLGKRGIVFVTHSLGGLLAKEMLRIADTHGEERLRCIATMTRAVLFLATPHAGSDLADVADDLGLASSSTADLRSGDAWLKSLDEWYRNNWRRFGWKTRAYYEKRRTYGIEVVSSLSADPHIEGTHAFLVDADHLTISKPESDEAQVYVATKALIQECLETEAASSQTVLTAYVNAVIQSFSTTPQVAHGDRDRPVTLDQVWVTLFGYPGGNRELSRRAHVRTPFGATVDPLSYMYRKDKKTFGRMVHSAENLETVLDRHPFALILGDPGSGKSTLLYQLAVQMARACRPRLGNRRIPVFIRAADFATFAESRRQEIGRLGTLLEFLGRQPLRDQPHYPGVSAKHGLTPIDDQTLHEQIVERLKVHSGVILIDGLDEVGDKDRRSTVATLIDNFLKFLNIDDALRAADIRVLITSRRVGYEQAPLETKVARYEIEPLDDPAIRKLAAKLFEASCATEEQAQQSAADFTNALLAPANERLRSLAENPFLLTLLTTTYLDNGGLPNNRADLYIHVVDNNLFKLLAKRKPQKVDVIVRVLTRLAFRLHALSPNGRISGTELLKILREYIQNEETRTLSAEELAELITKDSALMVERGSGEFAFAHRSLQEYLAGRQLLNLPEPGRQIVQHSLDARWREPIKLALGFDNLDRTLPAFENLLNEILAPDREPTALVPAGAMLIADAYYEISEFPEAARRAVLKLLYERYARPSFPGNLLPFRRFVEQFFADVWGRAPLDSDEELDVEDILVDVLTSDARDAAVAAAALVHERRIYSGRIANALVDAQRHDSPEIDWSIHRTLHALVSRPELEKALDFAGVPDDEEVFTRFEPKRELLRSLTADLRVVPALPEVRKTRLKLKHIRLNRLELRRTLMEHPKLAAFICANPSWIATIAQLGIGGFGDFEFAPISLLQGLLRSRVRFGVGSIAERRSWSILLDTALNPALEQLQKRSPEFRPEWLIRDPDDVAGIIARLTEAARQNINSSPSISDFFKPVADEELGRLCSRTLERVDREHRTAVPSETLSTQAREWATRFDKSRSDPESALAIILDTNGKQLAANPATLVMTVGLCGFAAPNAQVSNRRILWDPRRLDDYLVFALDRLDELPDSLGFFRSWFIMQSRDLLTRGGPLQDAMVETLVRLIRVGGNDPLIGDGLLAAPQEFRDSGPSELVAALRLTAEGLTVPYYQARSFLALAKVLPNESADLERRAERLVPSIADPMDRAIVLALLSTSQSLPAAAAHYRSRALEITVPLGEAGELFRHCVVGLSAKSAGGTDASEPVESAPPSVQVDEERAILYSDALRRMDLDSRLGQPRKNQSAEALAWAKRLFVARSDQEYSLAVVLDTIGKQLAADPEALVMSMGLCAFARPALAMRKRQLLWHPRRLDDYLSLALDVLDGLPDTLGFVHCWFVMQVRELFSKSRRLEHMMVETLIRLARVRGNDPLLADGFLAAPPEIRNLERTELIAALRDRADDLTDPYHRARAFIALSKVLPVESRDLEARAQGLVQSVVDPLDRAIVLSLMATTRLRPAGAGEFRQRALESVAGLGESAELFRRSLLGLDVSKFSETYVLPWHEEQSSAAMIGLSQVRSGRASSSIGEQVDAEKAWALLRHDPHRGWKFFLRYVTIAWLELTPASLETYRVLEPDLRREMLPYLTSIDESQLEEFVGESDRFKHHISLVASENGRWSASIMKDLIALLESDDDVMRARAQNSLRSRRGALALSEVGEETILAAVQELKSHPERDALFWFVTELTKDDPAIVDEWCNRIQTSDPEGVYFTCVRYCTVFNTPVWRVLLNRLTCGSELTQSAILDALRTTLEGRFPAFCNSAEFHEVLHGLSTTSTSDALAAKALDVLGFLPTMVDVGRDLDVDRYTGRPTVQAAAIVAGARHGLLPDFRILWSGQPGSEARFGVLLAFAIYGKLAPPDGVSSREWTTALIAACRGRWWNDVYKSALSRAAEYVSERWEHADDGPLNELIELVERSFVEGRARPSQQPRVEFRLLELGDALAVAASVAEIMPEGFAQFIERRAPAWLPELARVAAEDPTFVVRGAALRLLGAMPTTTEAALDAIAAGLFDVAFVSEIARDLCNRLPPLNRAALRKLDSVFEHKSLMRVVAGARTLAAACDTAANESTRKALRTELVRGLERVLLSDNADHPLIYLSSTSSTAYLFRRERTLGAELGSILFGLQAMPADSEDSQRFPRFDVQRTVFTVRSALASAGADRIEVADRPSVGEQLEHQFTLLNVAQDIKDVLSEIIEVCREQNYSVADFSQALAKWANRSPDRNEQVGSSSGS